MAIQKKYRILLWGSGATYNQLKNMISWYEITNQFEVAGIVSLGISDFKRLDSYLIVRPDEINNLFYDYIVVLSDMYFTEIVEAAVQKQGISRKKFIKYGVLQIPDLNFDDYIRLKESDISIISNNCWGGIVYKTLGLECRSPFKNLFILDDDFIKLLQNLKHYLSFPLKFNHFDIDRHSKKKYPVFCLDNIQIHCNHADSIEEAVENWERKVKKINYDNLFIEMYTESEMTAQNFCSLYTYKKKICFVPFEVIGQDYLMHLPMMPGQSEFWETVNSNAGLGTNGIVYNFVTLLLHGKIQYRVKNT